MNAALIRSINYPHKRYFLTNLIRLRGDKTSHGSVYVPLFLKIFGFIRCRFNTMSISFRMNLILEQEWFPEKTLYGGNPRKNNRRVVAPQDKHTLNNLF